MSAGIYRKRPVEVDAFQLFTADLEIADRYARLVPEWFKDASARGEVLYLSRTGRVQIATLEGEMLAVDRDWIIRGVKGELYPCKPDIFEATYELVAEGEGNWCTLCQEFVQVTDDGACVTCKLVL